MVRSLRDGLEPRAGLGGQLDDSHSDQTGHGDGSGQQEEADHPPDEPLEVLISPTVDGNVKLLASENKIL